LRVVADALGAVPGPGTGAAAPVAPIEEQRVLAMQPAHADAHIGLRRLDDQVDVVVHQAVREHTPPLETHDTSEEAEVQPAIAVVGVDVPLVVPSGEHMVDRARFLGSLLPWHVHTRRTAARVRPLKGLTPSLSIHEGV
jgi:hypothetical protein